jgi:hypothetical protein
MRQRPAPRRSGPALPRGFSKKSRAITWVVVTAVLVEFNEFQFRKRARRAELGMLRHSAEVVRASAWLGNRTELAAQSGK